VATDVGAVPEMIAHGETGFVTARGDKAGLVRHTLTALFDDESKHLLISGLRARSYPATEQEMACRLIDIIRESDRPLVRSS
jgi:glycosyltransferase involved in cell wall biosynthesis